ncbi:MAG TPA: phosphotransferase [Kofleriaceae bacterium]|nr:phosphotransferase [Kofleriaceae bacterium]
MTIDPREVFPAHLGEICDVGRIAGGLSGADVYTVTSATGAFVLRIQGEQRAAWSRTIALQRLASDAGVAPRLAWVDEARAISVSVKIDGVPFAVAVGDPAQRAAALMSVTEALARLHGIPLDPALVPPLDLLAVSRAIWASQRRRPGFPAWAAALENRLEAACAIAARDERRVFSHNDLNPMNMLWDGQRVWLLDWDTAGAAHPYMDLATLSNFLNLPDGDALGLLAAQERAPIDGAGREMLAAYRELSRIVYGSVFLKLVPDLAAITFASRAETLTLADCYARMAAGTLSPYEPGGQAMIAVALFKQCE